jgi:hypothetical protein
MASIPVKIGIGAVFLYKYKSVIKIYIPIDKVGKTCYDIYTNQEGW